MPDTVFGTLQAPHAILTAAWRRCYNYLHFIDEETEAQRAEPLGQRSVVVSGGVGVDLPIWSSPPSQHLLAKGATPPGHCLQPQMVATEEDAAPGMGFYLTEGVWEAQCTERLSKKSKDCKNQHQQFSPHLDPISLKPPELYYEVDTESQHLGAEQTLIGRKEGKRKHTCHLPPWLLPR